MECGDFLVDVDNLSFLILLFLFLCYNNNKHKGVASINFNLSCAYATCWLPCWTKAYTKKLTQGYKFWSLTIQTKPISLSLNGIFSHWEVHFPLLFRLGLQWLLMFSMPHPASVFFGLESMGRNFFFLQILSKLVPLEMLFFHLWGSFSDLH